MIFHADNQGTPGWIESRRGVITGSRFKDARDKLKSGAPSKECLRYAMDVARERCGGRAPDTFQNAAMRFGTEQEPLARTAYEAITGYIVDEAGFITTDDRVFGVSVDGLVDEDGMVEIKTMVSSDTLFTAVVEQDHSAYIDQIYGSLWLLGRKWCDLILWAPDLEPIGAHLNIRRIHRNDDYISAMELELVEFNRLVESYQARITAVQPNAELLMNAPPAAARVTAWGGV